jgi:hypothetical protein
MTTTRNLEDEVWSAELAYWGYFKAADLASFVACWHDDGVAWAIQPAPTNKEAIRALLAPLLPTIESWEYELKPMSVRVYNNSVGVTIFEAHKHARLVTGAEVTEVTKAIHTWLRTDNGWKIIGGMEAPLAHP